MLNGMTMGSLAPAPGTAGLRVNGLGSTFSMTETVVLLNDAPLAAGSPPVFQ